MKRDPITFSTIQCMTTVRVRDLPLLADVGINPDEIGRRQPLIVSVDLRLAADSIKEIGETVDYRKKVPLSKLLKYQAKHRKKIVTY